MSRFLIVCSHDRRSDTPVPVSVMEKELLPAGLTPAPSRTVTEDGVFALLLNPGSGASLRDGAFRLGLITEEMLEGDAAIGRNSGEA